MNPLNAKAPIIIRKDPRNSSSLECKVIEGPILICQSLRRPKTMKNSERDTNVINTVEVGMLTPKKDIGTAIDHLPGNKKPHIPAMMAIMINTENFWLFMLLVVLSSTNHVT